MELVTWTNIGIVCVMYLLVGCLFNLLLGSRIWPPGTPTKVGLQRSIFTMLCWPVVALDGVND